MVQSPTSTSSSFVSKKKNRVDYFVITQAFELSPCYKDIINVHVCAFPKSTLDVNFNFFAHLFPKTY